MLATYSALLGKHPLATKSATSGLLAVVGDVVARVISGRAQSGTSLQAFAIYGVAVSGPLPHYFYALLEKLVPPTAPFVTLKRLLLDRLGFAPVMTALFFVVTKRLQGESAENVRAFLRKALWPAIVKNWQWWTPAMIINLRYVPLQYRALFASCVAFLWNIYLATLSAKPAPSATVTDSEKARTRA